MRIVIALGGNALLRRGEPLGVNVQRRNIRLAARSVAALAREHHVVVTHGNGPQVGVLALQSESRGHVPSYPLDVLGAQSEGMIGYLIEQELINQLPDRAVATLLTQVIVEAADPAFAAPTKPIGPSYTENEIRPMAHARGWTVVADGNRFRRVVPSPAPQQILELSAIRLLVDNGVIVICAGGGGIPVTRDQTGALQGVEAVIDKDLSAALLAETLRADALLLLTDVPAVWVDWGTPAARPIRTASPAHLRHFRFPPGSMAPKIDAACRFVESAPGMAGIGALEDAAAILSGNAGTLIRREQDAIRWYERDTWPAYRANTPST
jgi:carbamate kinase